MAEPGQNRADAVSIGPVQARFWHIMAYLQGNRSGEPDRNCVNLMKSLWCVKTTPNDWIMSSWRAKFRYDPIATVPREYRSEAPEVLVKLGPWLVISQVFGGCPTLALWMWTTMLPISIISLVPDTLRTLLEYEHLGNESYDRTRCQMTTLQQVIAPCGTPHSVWHKTFV